MTAGEPIEAPPRPADALPDLPLALLGSFEFETPTHQFADQWQRVIARVREERSLYEFCAWRSPFCPAALTQWRARLASAEGLARLEQLRLVNRAVNELVPYASDAQAHGKADYWASPLVFIRNGGDCEDFAILKFFSLRELGFADEQLRLVVVRDRPRRRMHAVLVVKLAGRAYLLDNQFVEPVEHQHMLRYEPLYSANLSGQWVHLVTSEIRRRFVAEQARLPAGPPARASARHNPPALPPDRLFGGGPAAPREPL